jgi:hypothetical protein
MTALRHTTRVCIFVPTAMTTSNLRLYLLRFDINTYYRPRS